VKTYRILSHSSDSECAADIQEVLKMSISILQGLATEWALLHLVDESRFKFEAAISDVHLQTSPDVGTRQSWEIVDKPLEPSVRVHVAVVIPKICRQSLGHGI
jgi:hypothetical protein